MLEKSLPKSWFKPRVTLEQIQKHFEAGKKVIRIASGFFTVRGWNLIRGSTKGKQVKILVGIAEPGEDRARAALVSEIMHDLATGLEVDRRQAVAELVERIESNRFQMVDARATDHHGKLYLVDKCVAIVTSANTTGKGFIEQIEAGNLLTDKAEVKSLVQQFDEYFIQAKDLTDELLTALRRWLQMASPWDVYLKTLLALEDLKPTRRSYKTPTTYQVDMIAQALRHIRRYSGAMVVASTGLGKTVVGTHIALQLFEANEITNVMVIAPKAVKQLWKAELRDAGIPNDFFVQQSFDKENPRQDTSILEFETIAEKNVSEQWLIIIDESHFFRNRFNSKNRRERRAFARILSMVKNKNCKVLLLTGSPYSTDIENLNNQLLLLPHTAESRALFEEWVPNSRAWYVNDTDEFIHLDVVSQLTTPYVAKHYGQRDNSGLFIAYGNSKRYIPDITLHRIDFPLLLESDITRAMSERCFTLDSEWILISTSAERQVRIAWSSSPWELRDVLQSIIDGSYNGTFLLSKKSQRAICEPILQKLNQMNFMDDIKLTSLCSFLQELNGNKVIIFCERLATVAYLVEALSVLMPNLKIFGTIVEREPGSYDTKPESHIIQAIERFAPVANHARKSDVDAIDVFISTDAFGVGINLQDAPVVINYDIAWTPIDPTQRAGRVLRPWISPRTVQLYTFVPTLTLQSPVGRELAGIRRRWESLMTRHAESQKLIELPVLPSSERQDIYMLDVTTKAVMVKSSPLNLDALADQDISPYFQHSSVMQVHREYATQIPNDIISAKVYPGQNTKIYVLLKYESEYYWAVYEVETNKLLDFTAVQILDLIHSRMDEERAYVEPNLIEALAENCIRKWCVQRGLDSQNVIRECTLYLKPQSEADEITTLSKPHSTTS
ncbi:helicase-related protein [Tolypothrix bouteillei VB521301_2]|uniref:Helicase n=1 Tax=Tolypothrix bouteillei VB521301 TaxID=1479485 RepID=A0A0C1RP54_9CYAN